MQKIFKLRTSCYSVRNPNDLVIGVPSKNGYLTITFDILGKNIEGNTKTIQNVNACLICEARQQYPQKGNLNLEDPIAWHYITHQYSQELKVLQISPNLNRETKILQKQKWEVAQSSIPSSVIQVLPAQFLVQAFPACSPQSTSHS